MYPSRFQIIIISPVSIPEHFDAEHEHDDDRGVEGVHGRYEGGDGVAQQGRNDGHQDEGGDRTQKDDQFVVTH